MLRRLSIIALAGWAAVSSHGAAASAAIREQIAKVTINGSVSYDAGAALPSDSRMIVELRHLPALPNAPAVASQTIDLAGKQSPIPFEFEVERRRLVGNVTYVVRGVVYSGTRATWISDEVKIDVSGSDVNVNEIALKPAK
jgi:uncharacterized lipoprotein YbaY